MKNSRWNFHSKIHEMRNLGRLTIIFIILFRNYTVFENKQTNYIMMNLKYKHIIRNKPHTGLITSLI